MRLRHLLLASLLTACTTGPQGTLLDDDDAAANDDDSGDDDDTANDDDDTANDDDDTANDDDTADDDDDTADDDDSGDDDDVTPPPVLEEPSRWRSGLYPASWDPSFTSPDGLFLHDFSYAGYHLGEDAPPSVVPGPTVDVTQAPYNVDPTSTADSTSAIQAALDDVGDLGGGTVLLPAGTYYVAPPSGDNAALRLRHDGVVLQGAGRDATYVVNTATDMRSKQVIRVGPDGGRSWTSDGAIVSAIVSDAEARDTVVAVDDSSLFAPNDLVVVRSTATTDWIADHDMTGEWTTGSLGGPTFLRRVVAISGDDLTLDIPLRYPLLTRDDARVVLAGTHLSEVGLQDFSLGMVQHPGTSGWGDNDYSSSGTSAYDVHASDAIVVNRVVDGWILRVSSFQPAANNDPVHILSDGIVLSQARSFTVQDAVFSYPQYEGGGGNGYGFVLQGGDNLLLDCSTVSTRHGFSWKKPWASGNVVRGGSSANPRLAVDFHMHLSMANLIDGLILHDDFIDATYRPWGTVTHGHTTTDSVLWNTVGIDGGDARLVDSRQYDMGYAIGTAGRPFGITTTPLTDTRDTSPEDFVEGEGNSATLTPASLVEDQLARRLTGNPLPTAVELEVLSPSADAYVRDGADESTNFGADTQLRVKDAGSGYTRQSFLRFDLGGVSRAPSRATLLLECRTADSGGSIADLRVFGVSDDSWTESSVTWLTRPPLGDFLSRAQTDDPPAQTILLDVTEAVRAEYDGDGVVSLGLVQEMDSGLQVICDSREGAAPPMLEVELGPANLLTAVSVAGATGATGTSLAETIDGDLTTRWSNQDQGAQVTWDLGSVQDVAGVGIAFHSGDERVGFFELRVSTDGVIWTPIDGGNSGGRSLQLEWRLWASSVQARYVRFVGFGNSDSDWNSVTEFVAVGP